MDLAKHLLEKMLRKRIIGSKHIRVENVISSIPSHQGADLKQVIDSLLKKEWLQWYDKSKKALQLNKHKLKDIKEYLLQD